jgi:NADPH:quinone reductase-like Zn-dependent oxidoreductase
MKVVELRDGWGLEHIKLGTRPEPACGPGQVKLRMGAATVNFRDYVMAHRGYGRRSGELPLVILSDGAGTVVETGPGVTRVAVGDLACPAFSQTWLAGPPSERNRVGTLGGPRDGVMQELMVLSEEGVVKMPSHLDAVQAASLPCAALTAWHATAVQGVKAGDVVVVQGTGGVALFALQFAKLQGARTIITSSSDAKLERARALGADATINYRTTPEWNREVRKLTGGRGADLIVELGGAKTLEESLKAIRGGGTLAMIGVLSGGLAELNLGRVVTTSVRLQGIAVGSRDMFEAMVRAIDQHRLVPVIVERRYGFDAAGEAVRAIAEGQHFGKIAIVF